MSQPPNKPVRHAVPDTTWPTESEARGSRWFRPVELGPVIARSRTWVPAMVPWRATDDGFVTDDVLDWYARFARGRPGVLVVEATGIRDIPSGPLLRIGHDRFLPGLKELVATVRESSGGDTRLFIQIIDFLAIKRRPTREKYFGRHLQLTDQHRERLANSKGTELLHAPEEDLRRLLADTADDELCALLTEREFRDYTHGYRETVNDTHLPHVRDLPRVLPDLFSDAAARAKAAGFDGVELHYAHAYTMASFLSRLNVRDDGYGGSPEGRIRLPLEILARVRERVGTEYCVGARILGDEVIEGGTRIEDAAFYGLELARAGIDYISVSKGGKFEDAKQPRIGEAAYPYTGPSGHECMPTVRSDERGPFGRNVPLAAAIRRAVRDDSHPVPVVTSGGICSFEQAEDILARGDADVVGAARQSLADPDWFAKIESGRGEEVRRCVFTNYCEGLDQRHKQVTCQLWDREFELDDGVSLSSDGKRRLVAPEWSLPAEEG